MINDPYIEIINKTKSLNLDEAIVEQSIDRFLKGGADKALAFLIHDKKTPENEAWKLVEEIKKEFKSSYYLNALYAGVFMTVFLATFIVMLSIGATSLWMYFITGAGLLWSTYVTIGNLVRARNIKLSKS